MVKKPLIIPFLITLIFSTFSPITIHSANAAIAISLTADGAQYGGSGGSPTIRPCPGNSVVTGITRKKVSSYNSSYFRYFTITCTALDAQGALSITTSTLTLLNSDAGQTTANCSSGKAATGMYIYGYPSGGGGFVGAVNLICQSFPGGGTAETVGTDTSSGGGSNPGSSTCASGSFMTGVNARTGDGLDSVGASCSSFVVITLATINNQLYARGSITATATPVLAFVYTASGTCSVNSSSGLVTFTALGSCTITATYGGASESKTFTIIENLTQRIISRTGLQPNSLSSFIPPPYITTARAENVYACLAIVGATGATVLTSTNLNISLFILSSATMSTVDSGKSYTITGTLPQVQAAISSLKINSTSGRIMAANSGSIYLRVRANLIADATTDTECLNIGNDGRIQLYQYTSDQIRRKSVPQRSGNTP